MFEDFDDREPAVLRPRVEDVMREAKRRTVRRFGALSTCAVLVFGTAFAANRYFRSEQTVKIQEAAQRGGARDNSGPSAHGGKTPPAPVGSKQPKSGSGNASGTGGQTGPSGSNNGAPTNSGGGSNTTGNTFTSPGGTGGTTGGTTPGGGDGGGGQPDPPPATELVWSATANTTQSTSSSSSYVDVTVKITNPTAGAMSLDFKECDPSCKRVQDLGNGQIVPDWNASEGQTITTIASGATITYTEHIRMRTGAGFLVPGHYTLVIYGTSVPIDIVAS